VREAEPPLGLDPAADLLTPRFRPARPAPARGGVNCREIGGPPARCRSPKGASRSAAAAQGGGVAVRGRHQAGRGASNSRALWPPRQTWHRSASPQGGGAGTGQRRRPRQKPRSTSCQRLERDQTTEPIGFLLRSGIRQQFGTPTERSSKTRTEPIVVNFRPHHPPMHGVLRLVVTHRCEDV